jgi:predicted ABC-class ATPase
MVIGSCGDYFAVADTVIMMDSYKVNDVSSQAVALCDGFTPRSLDEPTPPNLRPTARFIDMKSLSPTANKVSVRDIRKIFYGSEDTAIDLSALEQKVEVGQINAIADIMQMLSRNRGSEQVSTMLDDLMTRIDIEGLDIIAAPDRPCNGAYSRMRKFELAATITRWRKLQMHQS